MFRGRILSCGGVRSEPYFAAFVVVICALMTGCQSEQTLRGGSSAQVSVSRPSELFVPEKGCIPDEATAIQVATTILKPVYGEGIQSQRPFRAELIGDSVWAVAGTLPPSRIGGIAYIEIRKLDGSVVGMGHSK